MHRDRWRLATLVSVFLLALTGPAKAVQQKIVEALKTPAPAAPAPTPAPPAPPTIPLEEVATQATQVANLIRGFATNLPVSTEIETIQKFLPQVSEDIALELKSTMDILKGQPALDTLQAQQEIWEQRHSQLAAWLKMLTDRATKLQFALSALKKLQEMWTRTRDAEEAAKAPAPILQQIDATLAAIEAAQQPHQTRRDELLDLQSKVAQQVAVCNTTLAQITALQQKEVGDIFTAQNPPIWNPDLWRHARAALSDRLPHIAASYRRDIRLYVYDPSRHMPRHIAIFVVLSLLLLAARRQVGQREESVARTSHATAVFDHVFAAALLATLMIALAPASPVPVTVKRLFQIAALVPIIVLTRRVVLPTFVPVLYALAILFATDTVRRAVAGEPPMGQGILVLEAVAGIIVLVWLWIRGARRVSTLRRMVAAFVLFSLAIGLVAAVFGFLRLARLVIPGVFIGGALGIELYASVQVAMGVVAYAFRVWPLRLLHMVQNHRELLERRIYRLMLWLAGGGWLARYLDYLGLWDPAWSMAADFLNTKLERGSISISVGDVGAFAVTLVGTYLLSAFIRFVLEEDVYPRARIATGQSYAVSSLLNYAVLTIGFMVALGVLGMDLTKITVLASAVGIGIGFGLQDVVNNFVSGLILLFERPIHVGDTVQVGSLQGRVRRIGIRASVVRTPQGAEIIVPNAQLITKEVTNWTLSDQLRRLDLQVGVNYGAEPKKVIELLEAVALAHPDVLREPAPRCLFMSYGDSSINFELRAWTEYSKSGQTHSDLAVAVYDAVYAAGMSFPFPQREVRVLSDHDAAPALPSGAAEKKTQP